VFSVRALREHLKVSPDRLHKLAIAAGVELKPRLVGIVLRYDHLTKEQAGAIIIEHRKRQGEALARRHALSSEQPRSPSQMRRRGPRDP
jgi:hypothetical protein